MSVSAGTDLSKEFHQNGFAVIDSILTPDEVETYRAIYDRFISGDIESGDKRSDLGSHVPRKDAERENITQIMWPSDLYKQLIEMPLHVRGLAIAKELIGDDAILDFDMLIHKAPHSGVATPWHQDAAYWIDLPDKRAVSIWVALDEAVPDNGCMWYVRDSHRQPLRVHRPTSDGSNIECDCSEDEPGATAVPLSPGQGAAHSGTTLHYSRGNTTGLQRRAYILNYRPASMIALEREQGMDHGLEDNERKVRNADFAEN
ncbi:phytanoyl-CoA dioxygenase family protein [Actinoplanes derwentensis]|uniref:Ectoine hydroxylase-related dioxygenase, phytanoyl-CoA dioxygenase (PhyH) family n=1 Tax=Actinoplanes derwentensis TaxID=113562 RepID=A0A1H1YCC4_9ACTN|nr:phytanoyl-CoA dioxygenase family protein [Actinoplanes derwentensis]GID81088.1 hypothetical protein Ade03nite_00120 [Actinoplanes derwentensis]SDT19087.1 Ectoine hydroxylase-related dioxygenase, phytanoyl-CoA dioxygenase (PhyH) family [Actinoplanes derwentensis]